MMMVRFIFADGAEGNQVLAPISAMPPLTAARVALEHERLGEFVGIEINVSVEPVALLEFVGFGEISREMLNQGIARLLAHTFAAVRGFAVRFFHQFPLLLLLA